MLPVPAPVTATAAALAAYEGLGERREEMARGDAEPAVVVAARGDAAVAAAVVFGW